jgi:iron complex outermembrane receptor protein
MRINLIFLILSPFAVVAQSPRPAQTLDAATRRPLPGVTVSVGNQPRAVSDADGRFRLDADSVTLSAVGYQPLRVQLWPDSTRNRFFLQPTSVELDEVIVRAYEANRRGLDVPAAVATLGPRELQRFAPTSLVPAMNTLPGVRMEERSPGSYRLSIRGSTLRSPFGVRNVKVYFNGIPFTDPGGNTYLQNFDLQTIGSVEVLKGPAGSLYGAGTGGVVLLESPRPLGNEPTRLRTGFTTGSYGLRQYELGLQTATTGQQTTLSYSNTTADGYREQTALRREVLSLSSRFFLEKQTLSATVLYSDLAYQTPGGLTRAQFEANPRQARPRAGAIPGAVEQQAAFRVKTAYLGGSHDWTPTARFSLRSAVYGTFTQVRNPSIRNWERRAEQSVGARVTAAYRFGNERIGGNFTVGGEAQRGFFNVKDYGNRRGTLDTLQTDDELTYSPWSLFAQLETRLGRGWSLTGGLSLNGLSLTSERLFRPATPTQRRRFDPVLSPRLAVLKKITTTLSAYASLSGGFSPPTVAEVLPSAGVLNAALNPERGTSTEVGLRGSLAQNRLSFDLTGYGFALREAIVVRRGPDGADSFVNAGRTRQNGLEASVVYTFKLQTSNFKLFSTYAFQDYHFAEYVSSGGDFGGNRLTGTPRHLLTVGADVVTRAGFYTNLTFQNTDRVPLNDANTDFAPAYHLLGGRFGFRKTFRRLDLDLFGGVDNALNESYTPAPDLNAAGGRYFNAAPRRNGYGGVRVAVVW